MPAISLTSPAPMPPTEYRGSKVARPTTVPSRAAPNPVQPLIQTLNAMPERTIGKVIQLGTRSSLPSIQAADDEHDTDKLDVQILSEERMPIHDVTFLSPIGTAEFEEKVFRRRTKGIAFTSGRCAPAGGCCQPYGHCADCKGQPLHHRDHRNVDPKRKH